MKRKFFSHFLLLILSVFLISSSAIATIIDFSGIYDNTAPVSAQIEWSLNANDLGYLLTLEVDNTSATTDVEGNINAPAITDIGFNIGVASIINASVKATAFNDPQNTDSITITDSWDYTESINDGKDPKLTGKNVDFKAATVNGVQAGLINPYLGTYPPTGSNLYWTTAYFYIQLDMNPKVIKDFAMKFQNVGEGGFDSITVIGTPGDNAVPEPTTWLLLGTGLIGLALVRKKINK